MSSEDAYLVKIEALEDSSKELKADPSDDYEDSNNVKRHW